MLPFVSAHPIPSARAFLIMREDLRFARRCMHGERRRNGRPFGRLQAGLCRSAGGDRRPDGPAAAFGCGKGAEPGATAAAGFAGDGSGRTAWPTRKTVVGGRTLSIGV